MITPAEVNFIQQFADGLESMAAESQKRAPSDPISWVRALFPRHVSSFAKHHLEVWDWAAGIKTLDTIVDPMIAIWARGGGKSTTAELATTWVGVEDRRKYIWIIRETQQQANDMLKNIGALLESRSIEEYYPAHANRKISKYGHSKGWNSQRLSTSGGLTIDAIGLDTAARGLKIEETRPDMMVFDDLDGKHDTPNTTQKKIQTLTHTLLPAGTAKTAIIGIQNLIIPHGIFTRLSDGRADFLAKRSVSGPHPAIEDLKTEVRVEKGRARAVIVGGTPTWEGQDIAASQSLMDIIGLRSFLQECQHNVKEREGALWKSNDIRHIDTCPNLVRIVVAVDPSGGGDEIGIIIIGRAVDGRLYVLEDASCLGSLGPRYWGLKVVEMYDKWKADRIVAERNFGGDLVESNITAVAGDRRVPVKMVTASRGKAVRAEPVATLYEDGLAEHVGVFPELEREMTQWVPGDNWSPNRLDGLVWGATELALVKGRRHGVYYPGMETDDEEEAA